MPFLPAVSTNAGLFATAIVLAILLACSSDSVVVPTSTSTPSPTPAHTTVPLATLPPPSANVPIQMSGIFEAIDTQAGAEFRLGMEHLHEGDYAAALESFQRAKEIQGTPSALMETSIGLTYGRMGMYDLSIRHHTWAVALNDISTIRISRASSYYRNGQCAEAMEDARIALNQEPVVKEGHHTAVEAHTFLALCYIDTEQDLPALEHMDALLPLAKEHGYSANAIGFMEEERALALHRLETKTPRP